MPGLHENQNTQIEMHAECKIPIIRDNKLNENRLVHLEQVL